MIMRSMASWPDAAAAELGEQPGQICAGVPPAEMAGGLVVVVSQDKQVPDTSSGVLL
jgi:hypothetical protein